VVPDQSYHINDLEIQTFRSNDQGVAFLICCDGLNIYFGGDLANWDWDNLTIQEHRFLVDYFAEVLTKINQRPVQIAFSNTDPRLKNWAGAAQFIDTIKPNFFVPMHTFGETQSISRFLAEHPQPVTGFFHYHQAGDSTALEFPDLEEDI
jgi:L-ascorbate metabolism protein UlaG (beta-lactamase superfamily)